MNDGRVSDDLISRGNLFQCEQVLGTNEKRYEFVRENELAVCIWHSKFLSYKV